jgi:hypothetical protein
MVRAEYPLPDYPQGQDVIRKYKTVVDSIQFGHGSNQLAMLKDPLLDISAQWRPGDQHAGAWFTAPPDGKGTVPTGRVSWYPCTS